MVICRFLRGTFFAIRAKFTWFAPRGLSRPRSRKFRIGGCVARAGRGYVSGCSDPPPSVVRSFFNVQDQRGVRLSGPPLARGRFHSVVRFTRLGTCTAAGAARGRAEQRVGVTSHSWKCAITVRTASLRLCRFLIPESAQPRHRGAGVNEITR